MNPLRDYPVNHWRKIRFGLAIVATTTFLSAQTPRSESVRAELIRSQRATGLTFAWIDQGVQGVSFDTRSVVRLQDSLEAFRPPGLSLSEHPEVLGIGMCWSHDQTKLATTMFNRSKGSVIFGILDLNSKQTSAIVINADQKSYVTSQCWSIDDKKLIYEADGAVRLYDIENDRANAIAKGTNPSWSPDGKWIGFRDGDTYYAMYPDGNDRKKLFRHRWGKVVSALYWSPDSRIVAYVRELGFLQGGALDAEFNELHVRRLDDGSEDRMCDDNVDWDANYQWINSAELMNHSESQTHRTK